MLESLADLRTHPTPLRLLAVPEPTLTEGEVLIRVTRCGVCHTELDEIEGRTPPPHLPVVLGHQVVGVIEQITDVTPALVGGARGERRLRNITRRRRSLTPIIGQRVGVAWIASAC